MRFSAGAVHPHRNSLRRKELGVRAATPADEAENGVRKKIFFDERRQAI
jgi:hypothetical protein